MPNKTQTQLTVREPFADYERGASITDAMEMKKALETNPTYVVQSSVPPAPDARPAKD